MKEKHYTLSRNVRSVILEGTTLRVVFVNGRIYDYFGVPEEIWESLEKALSIGDFINKEIKGKYEFKEVK